MPKITMLPVYSSSAGELTVFENILPGTLSHISYFKNTNADIENKQLHEWKAIICLKGNCTINVESLNKKLKFKLNKPNKVIILKPNDSFFLDSLSTNALILLLLSKEKKNHYSTDYKCK